MKAKGLVKALPFYLMTLLLFSACSSDDDNGLADVGLGIKVFFPTKVVTNQPMTINGSGFRAATEVEFPGGVKATNFEIVSDDMIRVNTPSGVSAEGGKIVVRTAGGEAESRLPLTIGHTNVSGFSKQPGETAKGGELITVFGTDLEFINSVELLDAEGLAQFVDQKDFYRKGTNNLVFRVPQTNIFKGTFVGALHTYDGLSIPMPELAYEPSSGGGGKTEIVKVPVWENGGQLGDISWSSDYRFAGEGHSTGEECYTVPQDVWERMKTETFYATVKATDPQIRVTSGWWTTNLTADDIFAGNELLTDNGDGTFALAITLSDAPDLLALVDEQHLLFTGDRYLVEDIYFLEEREGGDDSDPVVIWETDGSKGAVSWSSDYRFSNAESSTGEEIYAIPMDQWDIIKGGTFYLLLEATDPQIRVTTGWWSITWTGDDIFPGNEHLTDNGDGTFTLEVNLGGDPILDSLDVEHLLFTGDRFTPLKLYYYE